MYLRKQFLDKISWTSSIPQGFIPTKAEGCFLYDEKGVPYLDLLSGFGVNNIGHSHPAVIDAIQNQSANYLHTNVYGEHIQSPQVQLANLLLSLLPESLGNVYFLNSGSETIDAAIKMARKVTSRPEIVVCRNAYHGSTLAAESLRSDMSHSQSFRPLIPGINFIDVNQEDQLEKINQNTAAVITEIIQAEAGVISLTKSFAKALRHRCTEQGCLLVLDEIQTGLGRTGPIFAFQEYGIIPDILLLGKALGAGMPLSAMICAKHIGSAFTSNPSLGYISTFGGNPVCCAAGLAGLQWMLSRNIPNQVLKLNQIINRELSTLPLKEIRSEGLLIALDFDSSELTWTIIQKLFENQILAESFLFRPEALRIAPPLIITEMEMTTACQKIKDIVYKLLQ